MNKQTFTELLEKHDWYYMFSDDSNVYDKGLREENEIKEAYKDNSELEEIYNSYFKQYFE